MKLNKMKKSKIITVNGQIIKFIIILFIVVFLLTESSATQDDTRDISQNDSNNNIIQIYPINNSYQHIANMFGIYFNITPLKKEFEYHHNITDLNIPHKDKVYVKTIGYSYNDGSKIKIYYKNSYFDGILFQKNSNRWFANSSLERESLLLDIANQIELPLNSIENFIEYSPPAPNETNAINSMLYHEYNNYIIYNGNKLTGYFNLNTGKLDSIYISLWYKINVTINISENEIFLSVNKALKNNGYYGEEFNKEISELIIFNNSLYYKVHCQKNKKEDGYKTITIIYYFIDLQSGNVIEGLTFHSKESLDKNTLFVDIHLLLILISLILIILIIIKFKRNKYKK